MVPIRLLLAASLLSLGPVLGACGYGLQPTAPEDEDEGDWWSNGGGAGDEDESDDEEDADPADPADPDDPAEDPAEDPTDPDEPADEDPDDDPEEPTEPEDPAEPADVECTFDQFAEADSQTLFDVRDPFSPVYVHQSRSAVAGLFVELQILSFQYQPYLGPIQPGVYPVDGANYADCSLCMMVLQGCDESYSCDKIFFADEGDLAIAMMDGPDAPFAATLVDVVFREVTIDPTTYVSTPVPGGEAWCLDGHAVSGFADPLF